MKLFKIPLLLLLVFLAGSCTDIHEPVGPVTGMKPVYIDKAHAFDIYSESPRTLENPGKIYIYGIYLFIIERGEGVHVVNNADPNNPVKVSFINVPGINDVAVKGNSLYADNVMDLVAIDISDLNEVNVTKRIKDVYNLDETLFPAMYGGYFECADTSKGYVSGWVEAELDSPKCYR